MTDNATLNAEIRQKAGKGASRAARREGWIPAVIYGNHEKPALINICPREFAKEMHKPGFYTRIFNIKINDKTQQTIAKDVQLHPVTDQPIHIDFYRVTAKTQVQVFVPIHFINEDKSPGLKKGGVLNVVHHEVELTCRADAIPHSLEIDLAGCEIGHTFHLDAIQFPEGSKTSTDKGYTIATILAPKVGGEEAGKGEESSEATA